MTHEWIEHKLSDLEEIFEKLPFPKQIKDQFKSAANNREWRKKSVIICKQCGIINPASKVPAILQQASLAGFTALKRTNVVKTECMKNG
jgi:hypothetical protein